MVYYALLSLGKALGDKEIINPILATWLPNLVVGGIGIHFFRHALREAPLFLPRVFENVLASVGQRAQKLKPVPPH